jgi:hypothetical protein
MRDAGLVHFYSPGLALALQATLIYLFALICYPWSTLLVSSSNDSMQGSLSGSISHTRQRRPSNMTALTSTKRRAKRWKIFKSVIVMLSQYLAWFLLKYAYLISLSIIFVRMTRRDFNH